MTSLKRRDPLQMAGLPVLEWRSRLAWHASSDFSLSRFKVLPLILCESTRWWRDKILSSLRHSHSALRRGRTAGADSAAVGILRGQERQAPYPSRGPIRSVPQPDCTDHSSGSDGNGTDRLTQRGGCRRTSASSEDRRVAA